MDAPLSCLPNPNQAPLHEGEKKGTKDGKKEKGEWNWALSLNQASSCRCVIEALIRAPIAIVVEAAFSSQLIEMLDGSFAAEPFHVFATKRDAR